MNKINYSYRFNKKKKSFKKCGKLHRRPHLKGFVLKIVIVTPRKPNSARRPVTKLKLSTKKKCISYIPGSGHNLRKYCKVIIRGNGPRDTPNVKYRCCRGVLDFIGLHYKIRRRSIYATMFSSDKLERSKKNIKIKKNRFFFF